MSEYHPSAVIPAPTPIIDRELAVALEQAEAAHLAAQVRTYAQGHPESGARILSIAGGIAAVTVAQFGRKLNHVSGAAMEVALETGALDALEAQYAALGLPSEIDLCPRALPSAVVILGARGYRVNAFSNTYWRRLRAGTVLDGTPAPRAPIHVRGALPADCARFVRCSVSGFGAQRHPRPRDLLTALARSATSRSDTLVFIAEVGGELAGTAAVALLPTRIGLVAHMFLASTLPQFRNRGVQAALLQARREAAELRGAVHASITARPGTVSARNAERAGFQLAYTKPTFHKPA